MINSSDLKLPGNQNNQGGYNSKQAMSLTRYENEMVDGQTIYHKKECLQMRKKFYLRLILLLGAINLLIIINTFGQLVTAKNVTISNTSQITIKGDLLSVAGATITNDGGISLTGDLINNSGNNLFGTSSGLVTLNGNNQTVGGTDVMLFSNLTLSGTGTKLMQQDIIVGGSGSTGVLSLNDRSLDLNSNEITITNASNTAITRTSGYIVSETGPASGYGVIKWMVQNNSGVYQFPFGNAITNSYVPVSFEINQSGTGSNGFISLATYPTATSATPNNRPLPTGLTSLIDNYGLENASNVVDRWWVMDVANYTTQPVSSVSFSYRESEWDGSAGSSNVITESALQAQSNNGSIWTPQPFGNVNVIDNTVIVSNINIYNSLWTLAGSNNPLPVALLNFNAELNKDEEVDIDWTTATEVNNDFFTLEKSRDGYEFEPFAIVQGAGNSNNLLNYQSVDRHPYQDITYYRLKQTDFDGQYSYSDIKAVQIKKVAAFSFQVFPNPATDHFYVKFDEETAAQSLFIMDVNGKVIREVIVAEAEIAGANLIKINRNQLGAGMYFIAGSEGNMQKLVLQ